MTLLEMEPLTSAVKMTLQTGYVKNARNSSLLIIGKAESGKTDTMEEFKEIPGVFYTNDITPKILVDEVFPRVDEGKVSHLVVPDILTCLERNRATRQHLINILKTGIEEGITQMSTFHMRYKPIHKKKIQFGLITAITLGSYQQFKREWIKIGFLSRMIPFSYKFTTDKVFRIFEFISNEAYVDPGIKHTVRRARKKVESTSELNAKFDILAVEIGKSIDAYGTRMKKNLQALAKANAMLCGREKVEESDVRHIMELARWINYDFNPL